jgi:hypothetical protein
LIGGKAARQIPFQGLAGGGALAFFQFADKEDQNLFVPKMPPSPFPHIALNVNAGTQAGIEKRAKAAGLTEPKVYVLEHGYCRSIYLEDPKGMICEFTHDHAEVETTNKIRLDDAHSELRRWQAGDHHSNNMFR